MEFQDIVNDKDEVIGKATRSDIYKNLLTHRIVHVLVFNSKEKMALQLRSAKASFCPLHWCTTAGGHVRSGETYEEAALREFEEEVGRKIEIKLAHKDLYINSRSGDILKKFLVTFVADFDGTFEVDREEVEKVEFFTLQEIQNMIERGEKFHPELLFLLRKHYGIK